MAGGLAPASSASGCALTLVGSPSAQTGISIICLAAPKTTVVRNIFGGANNSEYLSLFARVHRRMLTT